MLHLTDKESILLASSETSLNGEKKNDCNQALAYAPYTDWHDQRIVRVCFQVMDDSTKTRNFPDHKDSYYYFRKLIENCNERLGDNPPMNLPIGNNTPALDPKYRMEITPVTSDPNDKGIYFNYDNELSYFVNKGKNRNNYKKDVIKKYGIATDSILNIFVMPHHPDSVKSKTYSSFGTGIALGTTLKVAGIYDGENRWWVSSTLLNHEIGHVLGLNHAWTKSDGCDDTPVHPNCWEPNGPPPCDGELVSNNMMDYNGGQMAITPCQLGRIHKNIGRLSNRQRKLVIPSWCDFDASKTIDIKKDEEWKGARDVNRNIVIHPEASLRIACRLHLAKGAKIIIKEKGQLILDNCRIHNACDQEWDGIIIEGAKTKDTPILKLGNVSLENLNGK